MSAIENNVVAFPTHSDELPLIPEGVYRLAFRRYKIVRRFNRDVLELWFDVADYGPFFGRKLVRYYSVRASEKRRNFTARPCGDFVREYTKVIGQRPRFGTAALADLEKHTIVARVATIRTDHRQQPLPEQLHYNTVRELLKREGG